MPKKTTLARIPVYDPSRHCTQSELLDKETLMRLWEEEHEQRLRCLSKILGFIPGLSFRTERPRPVKRRGQVIGEEPFRVVVETTESDFFESGWAEDFAATLYAVATPSMVHPKLPKEFDPRAMQQEEEEEAQAA